MSEQTHNTKDEIEIITLDTGFHAGAWKVAYADFVTAMMAFFLLLWLLNITTDDQKAGISNYFDPKTYSVSNSQSGAGGILGGLTMSPQGSMKAEEVNTASESAPLQETGYEGADSPVRTEGNEKEVVRIPIGEEKNKERSGQTQNEFDGKTDQEKEGQTEQEFDGKSDKEKEGQTDQEFNGQSDKEKSGKSDHEFDGKNDNENVYNLEKAREKLKEIEQQKFKEAEEKIRQAIESDDRLKALSKNIIIDQTPEGLRIQIVDEEGESMFASGSARMYQKTEKILAKIADIIKVTTSNELSIRGHTDSVPYGQDANYTNWELSTDRANASRRVMLDNGMPAGRLNNVVGKADTEQLLPDDPTNPRNRRISVILLKEELTDPNYNQKVEQEAHDLKAAQENETETAPATENKEEAPPPATELEAPNNEAQTGTTPKKQEQKDKEPTKILNPIFRPSPGQVQFP